jgi:putative OPT family oligopeptide transporter
MALLKGMGGTTLNEINITQTAMSAGAMVAGGIAFTLPGLWITGTWTSTAWQGGHIIKVLFISLTGMLLGTVLTWFLRPRFIEGEALPYPIGAAAAETITAGDRGGKKSIVLFGTMGFSAVFTYLRDSLGWIPSALVSKWLYTRNLFIGVWVSPMAAGIGYMIGTLYTGIWFLGAVISYLIIIPIGPAAGIFPSVEDAVSFKNTVGIGLMVGTGVGILISYITSLVKKAALKNEIKHNKKIEDEDSRQSRARLLPALATILAFVFSVAAGIGILPSLLLMAGVFGASAMAATITGQTGINPMEIFGIIILLAIRMIVSVDVTGAFFIAACVAIACGYAGDLLNDYKAGHILGTNPAAQLISQIVGGIAGAVIASFAMFAIIGQFGGIGPEKGLPAGQAFAVSQMVQGIGNPAVFGIALAVGALLYLLKVPSMTLGIGMYLSFEISSIVFIGGLFRFIFDRINPKSTETGNIAASGLLGGEGITGVAIAIIKMATGS